MTIIPKSLQIKLENQIISVSPAEIDGFCLCGHMRSHHQKYRLSGRKKCLSEYKTKISRRAYHRCPCKRFVYRDNL